MASQIPSGSSGESTKGIAKIAIQWDMVLFSLDLDVAFINFLLFSCVLKKLEPTYIFLRVMLSIHQQNSGSARTYYRCFASMSVLLLKIIPIRPDVRLFF